MDRLPLMAGVTLLMVALLLSGMTPFPKGGFLVCFTLGYVALGFGIWRLNQTTHTKLTDERRLRQENHQLLQQTHERLGSAIHSMTEQKRLLHAINQHAVVSITDARGRIIHVNDKFLEITNFDRQELIGKDHRTLRGEKDDDQFFEAVACTIREGRTWRGELCLRRKDGTPLWQDTTIVPCMEEDGAPTQFIAIHTNVTDHMKQRHQLEEMVRLRTEELKEARDQALRASQIKSDFLAAMSHEIRTPLHSVLGMLELIKDAPLTPQHREYVHLAISSGKGLLSLISDILDLSRVESGQLVLDQVDFNLRRLVDEVALTMAPLAHVKGVELTAFIPGTLPAQVRGDPNRLRQIFINLLGNAVKFTPEGGTVELYGGPIYRDDDQIEFLFEVRDTGVGVPETERETIFHRFTQVDGISSRYGGSGLGLSICRNLVQLMGGEIGAEENPDAPTGSVFHFNIRLARQRGLAEETPDQALAGLRILVVNSSGLQLTSLQDAMENWGVRYDSVEKVETAAEMLRAAFLEEAPYHLVILNQRPGEESRGYLPMLRKAGASPRFLLLTDLLDQGWDQASQASGLTLCIQKPFTGERLFTAVLRLIRETSCPECVPLPIELAATLERVPGLVSVAEMTRGEPRLDFSSVRILVVDDQHANLLVATGMLGRLGCRPEMVSTSLDGAAAVTMFKNQPFDLVLMDCQMPGVNGYDATRSIRQWEESLGRISTPIIAFTADATLDGQRLGVAAGMTGFLIKPVGMDEMRHTLSVHLPGRAAPMARDQQDLDDLRATLEAVGINDDGFREIAEILLTQFPELMRSLEREIDSDSWEVARATSHVIKGSMANTLFPRFKEPSMALHEAIRNRNRGEARSMLARMEEEFRVVEVLLRERFVGNAEPAGRDD